MVVVSEENRGDIVDRLKSQGTGRLILLSLITFGIHIAHYIKRQTIIINQQLDEKHRIDESITSFILILSYMRVILLIPSLSIFEYLWNEVFYLFIPLSMLRMFEDQWFEIFYKVIK